MSGFLRWIASGSATGAANMAIDESLLETVRSSGDSVLRTYGWNPPTLSLGYGQDLDDIDLDRCHQLGVGLVRRPTGGRAVLHWNELTYCFGSLSPEGDDSIQKTYLTVGRCLQKGLRFFGVDVELSRGRVGSGHRAACFSSTSRSEITVRGRKLVGSAQRRIRGALLQHGSLLVGGQHQLLAEIVEEESVASIEASAIHLKQLLSEVDMDTLARRVAEGFAEELGVTLQPGDLSQEEQLRADELENVKYGSHDHLHRRQTAASIDS